MDNLHIVPLIEQPQWLPLIAEWQQAQWRRYSTSGTLERRQQKLQQHLSLGALPITFVAALKQKNEQTVETSARPVGCVSLVTYRFSSVGVSTPWLANLFVEPALRRQGIGSHLLDFAVSHSLTLGLSKLFLFTHDQRSYYETRGWQFLRQHRLSGQAVDIMVLSG